MTPTTLKPLELLRREITYDDAIEEEENILQESTYPQQRLDLYVYFIRHKIELRAIVSRHLGLTGSDTCRVADVQEWLQGSFNFCIPVYINNWSKFSRKRVLLRFPLPYKVGESHFPGNADEKLRCEASTYVWIQENCADVPVPYLWGFGFSNGQSFSAPENCPFYARLIHCFRQRLLSLLGRPVPCRYIGHRSASILTTGYLLMDFIEETEAKMLSCSWEELQHDKVLRTNLFRGLSRVLLKLGRVPLPQIGSFTMNDEGFLSLTNRPLTLEIHQLENEGIPTHINRDLTYSTVESYLLDLLAYHDNRLLHQPNSVRNEDDCRQQMAALTIMRSLFPHFFSRDLRHGPFLLTLTDLHQSNIFVDDNWNIKYLIDLEWACSLPIEMQHPPYWLTNRCVDGLVEEHLAAFDELREEFMDAFEGEERRIPPTQENGPLRTSIMRRGWRVGNFWYYHAVDSSRLLYNIFCRHIQPKFASSHGVDPAFDRILSPYWSAEADKVVAAKIKDKEKYDVQLCEAFEAAMKEPQKEDE